MKETKTIPITQKIFTKENLKEVSDIFINQYTQSCDRGNGNLSVVKFSCEFCDNNSVETSSPEIFKEKAKDSTLDKRKSSELNFIFYDIKENKGINFRIKHGNSIMNQVVISGEDKEWTSSVFHLFEDTLEDIESQNTFLFKYKTLITGCLFIIIAIMGNLVVKSLIGEMFRTNFWDYEIILNIFMIGCFLITFSLLNWLIKLFPSIEFDFGPEKMKIEKHKRKKTLSILRWIGGIIIGVIGSLIAWRLTK